MVGSKLQWKLCGNYCLNLIIKVLVSERFRLLGTCQRGRTDQRRGTFSFHSLYVCIDRERKRGSVQLPGPRPLSISRDQGEGVNFIHTLTWRGLQGQNAQPYRCVGRHCTRMNEPASSRPECGVELEIMCPCTPWSQAHHGTF